MVRSCLRELNGGLEISGIAAIDIENHTAFHLEAVHISNDLKSESLLDHYAHTLIQRKSSLIEISRHVVADAYFLKYGFVCTLSDHVFEVVSGLRDDADLRHKYTQEQSTGRGRLRKYDGKVDFNKLKQEYVSLAKITHWLSIPKLRREAFSIEQVKTIYHNELLLKRFFDVFGIKSNLTKNKTENTTTRYYGTRAA